MRKRSGSIILLALFMASTGAPTLAEATTPDVTAIKHHRDFRGPNSIGINTGDRLVMGSNSVVPSAATTGVAVQGATSRELVASQLSTKPDEIARSVAYDPSLTGAWTLTYANDGDVTVVDTAAVGIVDLIPLAEMLTTVGPVDATPTFSWTTPVAAAPDQVQIRLFDRDSFAPSGREDQIHLVNIVGSATSYTVPAALSTGQSLQPGGRYTVAIGLARVRAGDGSTLTRSRAFLDFDVVAPPVPLLSGPGGALLALGLTLGAVGLGRSWWLDRRRRQSH